MDPDTAKSAPTGCYKCGRPGHWSRDCPSSSSSSPNPNNSNHNNFHNKPSSAITTGEKPATKRATRPKLTPELLLSDDGLGFVLKYFPRSFKYRGRGREVDDLGNLIRLYSEWHKHLLSYYSFDQFVRKTEQIAATKRVKRCIKELRDRVASGGDPTKLYEDPVEHNASSGNQGTLNSDEQGHDPVNLSSKGTDADPLQELMLNEIYENVTEDVTLLMSARSQDLRQQLEEREPCQATERGVADADAPPPAPTSTNNGQNNRSSTSDINMTKEQRARMEANRLKALERAKGSSSHELQITDEQKARMEANRLKALERAAARAKSQQTT